MKYCNHCYKALEDDAAFCTACGKSQVEDSTANFRCPVCGKELDRTVSFCPLCGASVTGSSKPVSKPTSRPAYVPVDEPKKKKPIFKRWWFWAIIVVAIIITTSSGDSENSQAIQQPSADPTISGNVALEPLEVTISETVLYNEDGIRITAKGIEETFSGIDIKLLVENDTDNNIAVSCDDFVVNGITMYGYMYIDVAAGKKTNDTISFLDTDLDVAGINQIATIKTFDAYISDTDTYLKTKDIAFEITTSLGEGYVQLVDDSGVRLYAQNGITVIAKKLTDDYMGATAVVLIKNMSGDDVIVQAENVSVNGYTVSTLHSDAICDGTARFSEIDLYQSSLEENGIEEVEELTFELIVLNPKTFQTIAKTGELRMSLRAETTKNEVSPNPGIDTDEGLLTVEITLPASLFEDQDMDIFDTDAYASENGFLHASVNGDGSVNIVMTKAKHAEMLAEMTVSLETTFAEFVESEDTPYIKRITHNGDFSKISMEVIRSEYESSWDMTPFSLGFSAMFYQMFLDMDCHVEVAIIDFDSGEIIDTVVYPDDF